MKDNRQEGGFHRLRRGDTTISIDVWLWVSRWNLVTASRIIWNNSTRYSEASRKRNSVCNVLHMVITWSWLHFPYLCFFFYQADLFCCFVVFGALMSSLLFHICTHHEAFMVTSIIASIKIYNNKYNSWGRWRQWYLLVWGSFVITLVPYKYSK